MEANRKRIKSQDEALPDSYIGKHQMVQETGYNRVNKRNERGGPKVRPRGTRTRVDPSNLLARTNVGEGRKEAGSNFWKILKG